MSMNDSEFGNVPWSHRGVVGTLSSPFRKALGNIIHNPGHQPGQPMIGLGEYGGQGKRDQFFGASAVLASPFAGPSLIRTGWRLATTPIGQPMASLTGLQKGLLAAHRVGAAIQLAPIPSMVSRITESWMGNSPFEQVYRGTATPLEQAYVRDFLAPRKFGIGMLNPSASDASGGFVSGEVVGGNAFTSAFPRRTPLGFVNPLQPTVSEISSYKRIGQVNDIVGGLERFTSNWKVQRFAGVVPWKPAPLARNILSSSIETGVGLLAIKAPGRFGPAISAFGEYAQGLSRRLGGGLREEERKEARRRLGLEP